MSERPYIFISYRRADTMAATRALTRFLHSQYGRHCVFVDVSEIRDGSQWKLSIYEALGKATVFIPMIGENWTRLTDEFGNRRIDQEDDWVRKEIEFALTKNLRIIPIYIGISTLPARAFPQALRSLADIQGRCISSDDSSEEWRKLAQTLQTYGLGAPKSEIRYPRATVLLKPFNDDEIATHLLTLPGWRCESSPVPGMEYITRNELHKTFEFQSFIQAIDFMQKASLGIDQQQHHPRWENIWCSVSVWLSTWDVQFQVSELDIRLAQHLDEIAKTYSYDRSS
jgi:pterin-4a-carbinolamine dehydratase